MLFLTCLSFGILSVSKKKLIDTAQIQPKTLLLGTYLLGSSSWTDQDYFSEFLSLVQAADVQVFHSMLIRLRKIDFANFLTKGKLEDLINFCAKENIERIIVSRSLTLLQHRNLEKITKAVVVDRTELILEIFEKAAVSAEGKLQVEIAQVKVAKTKMAGLGVAMGQQQFGAKARGPGETEKEFMTRYYANLISNAEKKLAQLKKSRETQRKKRIQSGKKMVSLVGYTNVGKSSILNAMTSSEVISQDKLFVTLDTTTKELYLKENSTCLISDTVGFISDLPHSLIEAFKSTLDELRYSDLLLHVLDVANSSWQEQMEVVEKTLEEINVKKPVLYVFNKVDKLPASSLKTFKKQFLSQFKNDFVFSSAISKDGIVDLKNKIIEKIL